MTSTVKVNNLRKVSESADRDISGVAAAWVNFDGTGVIATRDSLNVSSLTDNGTGDYDTNFTNNFSDANHIGSGLAGEDGHFLSYRNGVSTNSASAANIAVANFSGSRDDTTLITFSAHGDLA